MAEQVGQPSVGSGRVLRPLPPLWSYRTVLLDLDGTVYVDDDALPGAAEFIAACHAAGCLVGYVTNLSLLPKSHCLDTLARIGVRVAPRQVLTAVDVLHSTLDGRVSGRFVATLAESHVVERLRLAGYVVADLRSDAAGIRLDAVVLGQVAELDDGAVVRAAEAVARGVPVLATSTHGRMPTRRVGVLAAADVVAAVAAHVPVSPIDCGKPSTYFSSAIDELVQLADPVLVVGDSDASDMELARTNGWFGLLLGEDPPVGATVDHWAPDLRAVVEEIGSR